MRLAPKLQSRLLILVLAPLLFALSLVSVLVVLQKRVEDESARISVSKANIATLNDILKQLYQAGSSVVFLVLAGDRSAAERYINAVRKSTEDFAVLRMAYSDEPLQLNLLAHMEELEDELVAVMNRPKKATETGDNLFAITESQGIGKRIWKLTQQIAVQNYKLLNEENKVQLSAPVALAFWRKILYGSLAAGVLTSILIAVMLVRLINRDIVKRLEVVVENTRRIAADETLLASSPGEDEIAYLDGAVHQLSSALREAERKEKAILENAADVICVLSGDGKFEFVSPASKKLWGYEESELLGDRLVRFIPNDEKNAAVASLETCKYQQIKALNWESGFIKADGSDMSLLWSAIWSEPDKSFFLVAHDTTEKRRIERFRREFLSMVGHDLRTPLTSVQFFLTLLAEGAYEDIPEEIQTKARMAEFDVGRLIRLVSNLLDVEKHQEGKLEFDLKTVSALAIVKQGINSLQPLAEALDVKIETTGADLSLRGDEPRLIQVIVNLLANAVSFSPPKSKVEVSIEKVGGDVEIRIGDHGRGIPEKSRSRIFERFEQEPNSNTKDRVGSGLGLSICKAIVEGHQGKIGLESVEGVGSTFWFRIPSA